MRVVLAENMAALGERLRVRMSELPGVEVLALTVSVEQTLRAIAEHSPDLVVLDLRLNDGSGFDVMRRAQQQQLHPAFMMLTLFPAEATRRYFHALGGEFFFDKAKQLEEALALMQSLARQPAVLRIAGTRSDHGDEAKP